MRKLTVVFLIIVFSSCEKKPFDYRNKYLGKYNFTVNKRSFNTLDSTYFSGTEFYKGDVKYGSTDSTVLIQFLEKTYIESAIDKEGKLYKAVRFIGEFESNKKVKFSFRIGGVGGGTYTSVIGEKK